ncbi:FAD-dependent oxidoreductase [Nocardia cyriacigeorgica]|uniref:FAD-dependent oxidoreductase n=1 Tax=Nocardia cyriacigeorgica TaxID=135487 RepID=A0A6P1D5C1_9NOCA|nr:FAD-dependent oxidoreductase [Nocardia cyriacigeorgica]NEW41636.1 FAD-dependent oxidoreductase [Nocardia cyriacigeorgica]NEW44093.1 FAD-dependent oxidoreductase [Nocardia cyriacigeorgica]NEW52290.1 FAD-dependent oxidoreductase [Nocardia cyriacigeorgica]NEW56276.1 FAD-dependent oxidoreductase [Nocardia cyriacigeorgica]
MRTVLILGAGFGGLELAASLSESSADEARVVVIDRNDAFTLGFAKLDVLFRGSAPADVRHPYAGLAHPGVEFRQEEVTAIDPGNRRVVTDRAEYEPDILVVALGADYDQAATPGFVEDGHEYYSIDGACALRDRLADFDGGTVLLAILGVPFKCPPAPYEGALLLAEHLERRGLRDRSHIHVITPMDSPIPVSAGTSAALVEALTQRGIEYSPGRRVHALDPDRHVALTRAGELPYDLFIGIPVHRAPAVVDASGLTVGGTDGWIAVDPRTLETRYPGVYALGDCADAPVPRAGVFAEDAARTVAAGIAAILRGAPPSERYRGRGSCHIEFGDGLVGKVDADFLSGPTPTAPFTPPSLALAREKSAAAAARLDRWFAG